MMLVEWPTKEQCPVCRCKWRKLGPPSGPHAGAARCLKCGRWTKWLSKDMVARLKKSAEEAAQCQG